MTLLLLWFSLLACGSQGSQGGSELSDSAADPPALHPGGIVVRPGIEVLLSDSLDLVTGRRVGLITNQTGIDSRGISSIDRLAESPAVELVALFSPEHGIRGTTEGGIEIGEERDARTGLPVHSLYGGTRKPTPEMLEDVDVLLFDIQDVGARYYTYISTMALAMEAAGEAGIPFIVLDRPDPVGGVAVQGNVLDPAFSSFVGLYPIPMRHGMTPGELARLFAGEFGIRVQLHVIPLDGWHRDSLFPDTRLPWVPPSPNMPSVESALHYPGTCLFEGTNLSVGRGTAMAFQVVGAPWLDGEELVRTLATYDLQGVRFEAVRFTPVAPGDGKFGGQEIPGVRLVYLGPEYDPTLTALALLRETRRMSGDRWAWREGHFDQLAGTDRLRLRIEAGEDLPALREGWDQELNAFRLIRERYLLY